MGSGLPKATLSVVIPHYPLPGTEEALQRCTQSLRGHDELIIVVNDGIGYGPAVNRGINCSNGDYIIVCNNDITLIRGDLGALREPSAVTVPYIEPRPRDDLPRAIFCSPRWVFEEIGLFDERFTGGYFEDDDFIRRLEVAGIPMTMVPGVVVHHLHGGGLTMKQIGEQEHFDMNKRRFEEKWQIDHH